MGECVEVVCALTHTGSACSTRCLPHFHAVEKHNRKDTVRRRLSACGNGSIRGG